MVAMWRSCDRYGWRSINKTKKCDSVGTCGLAQLEVCVVKSQGRQANVKSRHPKPGAAPSYAACCARVLWLVNTLSLS